MVSLVPRPSFKERVERVSGYETKQWCNNHVIRLRVAVHLLCFVLLESSKEGDEASKEVDGKVSHVTSCDCHVTLCDCHVTSCDLV